MELSLPPHIETLIRERVRSGEYGRAEDVVAAALATLDQQERFGEFEPGELDCLLAEGERSGGAVDGEEVLKELGELGEKEKL